MKRAKRTNDRLENCVMCTNAGFLKCKKKYEVARKNERQMENCVLAYHPIKNLETFSKVNIAFTAVEIYPIKNLETFSNEIFLQSKLILPNSVSWARKAVRT